MITAQIFMQWVFFMMMSNCEDYISSDHAVETRCTSLCKILKQFSAINIQKAICCSSTSSRSLIVTLLDSVLLACLPAVHQCNPASSCTDNVLHVNIIQKHNFIERELSFLLLKKIPNISMTLQSP